MKKEVETFLKERFVRAGFNWDDSKDAYSNYASQLFGVPYNECTIMADASNFSSIGTLRRETVRLGLMKLYETDEGSFHNI